MRNTETAVAWRYHEATKHSYTSVRAGTRQLDWDTRPIPFKAYPDLPSIPLPLELRPSGMLALTAIAQMPLPSDEEVIPDLRQLAHLLRFSAGITKRKTYARGEILLRAASCTGALYEIEVYIVCQDLPGLSAGVYHFDPAKFALHCLRAGDCRGVLARATAWEPAITHAPLTLIHTGIYWRNAWKYRTRTYRHFGWDNGTMLANTLATSAALHLPARVVCGFVDGTVNALLTLDSDREVAFSMVPIGRVLHAPPDPPEAPAVVPSNPPHFAGEVDYPIMREMHGASTLTTSEDVTSWHMQKLSPKPSPPQGNLVPLRPLAEEDVPPRPLEEVVLRRGSTRQFRRDASISFEALSTILFRSTQGISADFLEPPGALLNDLYLIVHAVDGLTAGAYTLHRDPWALELLRAGQFREKAGYLGLEQALAADASAVVFFIADLHRILDRFGNRGYRAAQLEAGIVGGKLYLAAYALGLGATGLTFYDDDVVEFFSPHAIGKSAIFMVALGKGVKRQGTHPAR